MPAAGAEEGECSRHSTTRRRLRRGRGGQGRPHHRRRGVHGTQQELHQGSAGAPCEKAKEILMEESNVQKFFLYANDEDAAEDGDQDAELLIVRFEKG
uniref:Uncharacterized protein n=1 Tax=Zea mays TaxID=4577 RepID=A0A804M2J2_MAIZE